MSNDLSQLTAGDIMNTNVLTIAETTPLHEVERLLGEHRISGAPVTNAAGHIVGVVSMRDLIERYAEDAGTYFRRSYGFYESSADDDELPEVEIPEETEDSACDIMTAQVHTIDRSASVAEVARKMLELEVHRILVSDQGHHVGLISTYDVLRAVAG